MIPRQVAHVFVRGVLLCFSVLIHCSLAFVHSGCPSLLLVFKRCLVETRSKICWSKSVCSQRMHRYIYPLGDRNRHWSIPCYSWNIDQSASAFAPCGYIYWSLLSFTHGRKNFQLVQRRFQCAVKKSLKPDRSRPAQHWIFACILCPSISRTNYSIPFTSQVTWQLHLLCLNSIKYLCIYIDKKLIFSKHTQSIKNKFNASKFSLFPLINHKNTLPVKTKIYL